MLERPQPGYPGEWLAARRLNSQVAVRLFCFPYAGGSEAVFKTWQEGLPESIEVCPVQLPGRGARAKESPFSDLRLLVEAAAEALISCMDRPFAIFGHSMGGAIAFELARQLRREYGLEPVHLFIAGRCSPQWLSGQTMPKLSDADLAAVLERGEGTPKEVHEHPELVKLMLPLLRADFAVGRPEVLRDEPPLDCPMTVFGGLMDLAIPRPCLEGWRELTHGRFLIRMVRGGHFFLRDARSLILSAIATELHRL
jgi:medium-chain acyl-[acyl-carrier-protein] hydrolase